MSLVQNIAKQLCSDRLYESMRQQSESWVMECPCGAETSVWEMGGIRWKAVGEPRRFGRCRSCGQTFWGKVQRRDRVAGQKAAVSPRPSTPIALDQARGLLLWIDGVGGWLVLPGSVVTFGGPVEPGSSQAAADLCVLASLRRLHATIERTGEAYQLLTSDGGQARYLSSGEELNFDGRLTARFRIPSVLSPTAVLTPGSAPWPRMFAGSGPPVSVDGVVLMDEVCLLGPGHESHISCSDWEETVILFRRDGQLWCRCATEFDVDGKLASEARRLSDGSVVSGQGWRFRVEVVRK